MSACVGRGFKIFHLTYEGGPCGARRSADINLDWASKFIRENFDGRLTWKQFINGPVYPAVLKRLKESKFLTVAPGESAKVPCLPAGACDVGECRIKLHCLTIDINSG